MYDLIAIIQVRFVTIPSFPTYVMVYFNQIPHLARIVIDCYLCSADQKQD